MDYSTNSEFMDPSAQEFVNIIKKGTYNIYIQHGKQIRSGVISRPDFVLLNLQEAVNRILTKPNSLIKDYSIMSINAIDPEDIMINTCKNITDPHTHSNSNCVIS